MVSGNLRPRAWRRPRGRGCFSGNVPAPCVQGGIIARRWLARSLALWCRSSRRGSGPLRACRRASIGGDVPSIAVGYPNGDLEQREIREIVGDEVDRLPLKYRCAMDLCYFQGMTHEQAARQLDWPLATVKSRQTRCRLRLRRAGSPRHCARRGGIDHRALQSVPRGRSPGACAVDLALFRATRSRRGAANGRPSYEGGTSDDDVAKVAGGRGDHRCLRQHHGGGPGPSSTGGASSKAAPSRRDLPAPEPALTRGTRKLSSGTTVEVLAISPYPSGPDTWWRPDGTPLPRSPHDPSRDNVNAGENKVSRTDSSCASQISRRVKRSSGR